MKIKEIMLQNFAKVNDVKINMSPGVTLLVGGNGAGKTTIGLNGIWFVLKGLAQKGPDIFHAERFRFIGPAGKSANGTLVLFDEKEHVEITVTRKLTKSATELRITASDGRELDQAFLDSIFNMFTLNIFSFPKLSPKEQALALGLNVDEFDSRKSELYTQRRDVGREVKRLKAVVDSFPLVEEVEPVNLSALLSEKNRIEKENNKEIKKVIEENLAVANEVEKFNREQKRLQEERTNWQNKIKKLREEITSAQKALKQMEQEYALLQEPQKEKVAPPEKHPDLISTDGLSIQIESAESINEKARLYVDFVKAKKEHKKEADMLHDIETEYTKNEQARTDYIQSKKLPFPNMTIEDGGLLVNGKPFSEPYFSKGEIMKMSATLAATMAKENDLKYVFIPDAMSLDRSNRESLFTSLSEKGFQVMAEIVDTKKVGENSILLRDGNVVEGSEEEISSLK